MTDTPRLYDPLTWQNLMAGLVVQFDREPLSRIDAIDTVYGPGIYALFYDGDHEAYRPISGTEKPIYVGRADPPGARKGPSTTDSSDPALQRRLREHARSLRDAANLEVGHFQCRYLAVVPVWIPLAERFLIEHYRPVWNSVLDGFGNHHQGRGRTGGEASWWDTMHPGREWANRMRRVKTQDEAAGRVAGFFGDE